MSATISRRRVRRHALSFIVPIVGVSALAVPGVAGAGAAGPAGDDPNLAMFCVIAEHLNSQDGVPTAEQVNAYAAVAPESLAEPIGVLVDLLAANDGNFIALFAIPEAGAAFEAVTAGEVELCGFETEPEQDPSVTQIDESATRVDMTFADYEFHGEFPTAAGRYSFVFANEGAEPHIAVLFQVAEGFTLDEVLAAEGEEGVEAMYESSLGLPGGDPAVLTVDLTPGEWVMLCPIPDANGMPHFEHGMVHTFTVA